ncbi:hypothetical protein BB560_002977 [Smittium megazygosporum]|uniref:Major facilitator superfamily (MFS) profile domain-containing protein n=1 Tax=Smittium megazygosporum TaxID=133381 RepID=A0A2T9ZD98_9FUNG|nr:hypothetical protein BB560_002977 [Smittium megazygosporum]
MNRSIDSVSDSKGEESDKNPFLTIEDVELQNEKPLKKADDDRDYTKSSVSVEVSEKLLPSPTKNITSTSFVETPSGLSQEFHVSPSESKELQTSLPASNTRQQSKSALKVDGDFFNITLLIILYWLQGVPLGLTSGSIPFLLKEKMSFSEISVFSLASYPYSLKLFWSPIVDACYNRRLGRRKSWIVPVQFIVALIFWILGSRVNDLVENPGPNIKTISIYFFLLVLLCATQDIAVDGWALTLLSKENLAYASTCQTIGLNSGYFMSFTVFLALNTPSFSNKYLRSVPHDYGVWQLGGYMQSWAVIYTLVTIILVFLVKERQTHETMSISSTYKTIYKICKLPDMIQFIIVLFFTKFGFVPNDSATQLKLLEKGMNREDMALAILIDFPIQIVFGYYAARWSIGRTPMKPWRIAFLARLGIGVLGMATVRFFPSEGISPGTGWYFYFILVVKVAGSMASTVMFVGLSAFITRISDPSIGGTYMTLLNTLSNFGGTWPVYFILRSVDWFTKSQCSVLNSDGNPFSCATTEVGKELCSSLGGRCIISRDGYYTISIVCISLSLINFMFFIRHTVKRLERLPLKAWRIQNQVYQ